ncbi:MAG: hypothetical protein IT380_20850 [Myxococcales bacterium]|nr:hypothetical protein [Myxococcales bacterium]
MTRLWLAVAAVMSFGCVAPTKLTRVERRALRSQGEAAYEAKDFQQCAEKFGKLAAHYSQACCAALGGDRDAAFRALDQAHLERRPVPLNHLISDTDLDSLHGDARWPALLEAYPHRLAARVDGNNKELTRIFDEDQGDRQGETDWALVAPRDLEREKRTHEILAANGAITADDFWHAAMVFQHGSTPAHIERARMLSLEAIKRDPEHDGARWLVAAATDRKLMFEGKPQKYGTQYKRKDDTGPWELWPVDPTTTDAERAEWNVPTLAEAQGRAAEMNAGQ